jgi:hypothetical protein
MTDSDRVPNFPPPYRHCLHHLQELDNHPHRIRRGALVWRLRHTHGSLFIWLDGFQLHHCGLGRHSACTEWHRPGFRGRYRGHDDSARWIPLDDVQLPVHRHLCFGHAKAHQVDQLQGL